MIDLSKEHLIALKKVPNYLAQRGVKKHHTQTIFRWADKGLRGRKLESWWVGGERYTSVSALNRFISWRSGEARPTEQADDLRRALYGKPR